VQESKKMTDTSVRNAGLRELLTKHRKEMQDEVQNRIRGGRVDRPPEVGDDLEHSDADIQGAIEFALLQLRAETLTRIEEALARLDAGEYGTCFECAGEISERRLQALPFAARCQACEEKREQELRRTRQIAQRRGGSSVWS
jgi:DnaK suppressor protein